MYLVMIRFNQTGASYKAENILGRGVENENRIIFKC